MKVEIDGDKLEYKVVVGKSGERHVVIVRGLEVKGDLAIPAKIDECPVTVIGDGAFSGCGGLTGVSIPDSVTYIMASAFWGCKGLKDVILPKSVNKIGSWAFMGCNGLTHIEIPDGVMEIESHTFATCSALASIKIPDSVTKVGWSAFANCTGLQSLTISAGVTEIEREAFKGCAGLTSITIPDQVKSIGKESFADCGSLQAFKVAHANRVYKSVGGLMLSKDGAMLVAVPAGLTSVTIPEGVEVIGPWSFSGCSRMMSVTIPGSVTVIGDGAFSGCSGLASITIPGSVTNIGEEVFKDCLQLQNIINPTKFGSHYMPLSGHGLARMLINHPEFAEKCDFGLLQGDDWAYLLSARPEFADKCVLWGLLNEDDWATLLKHQPRLANNRLDGRCTEIKIEVSRRAHGVSRYNDVAEIERCIKKSTPIAKPIDFECFIFGPPDAKDLELTYIDTCMIHFKNGDGAWGSVEMWCHLTKSGPLLSCDPQVNVVRTGGWKDPCRRAGRTVPVEYARELHPQTRSLKIKGDFDPRKLTIVVEDGFLLCIRYDGCVVTEISKNDYLDAWQFSIVYRHPDGGKVSFGEQYIDCY